MNYSVIDILSFYKKITNDLKDRYDTIENLTENNQLLDMSGGLALTNSVHEMFIKAILRQHQKQYSLSNKKYTNLVAKFKSPADLNKFLDKTGLDLEEGFKLNKGSLGINFTHISSYTEVIDVIKLQRISRNEYLHGEFLIDEKISKETFKKEILNFQKLHLLMLMILDYSYIKESSNIPNLSLII